MQFCKPIKQNHKTSKKEVKSYTNELNVSIHGVHAFFKTLSIKQYFVPTIHFVCVKKGMNTLHTDPCKCVLQNSVL